jgi:hypothetical protein
LQSCKVHGEADLSHHKDGRLSRIEQVAGESSGIGDADSELRVQFPDKCEPDKRLIRDASGHSLPNGHHIGKRMLCQHILGPLAWGADRKCCHGNVIKAHVNLLLNKLINADH